MRAKETILSQREFAHNLCNNIQSYWRVRGYNITVGIDLLAHHQKVNRNTQGIRSNNQHRVPIFPIHSNIGFYGFPPGQS